MMILIMKKDDIKQFVEDVIDLDLEAANMQYIKVSKNFCI